MLVQELKRLYRMAVPFLLLMLAALLVITFNEDLSLWLVERWASSGAAAK